MDEAQKIAGVKSFLKRTKSTAELEALAITAFSAASEEVVITSINSEGAGTSGTISFPKWLLLQAIEECLAEGSSPRKLCTVIDRGQYSSPL
ncbi:MAG: hypothetical protein ACOYNN_04130 [Terrimicrobiaceae bacterium]